MNRLIQVLSGALVIQLVLASILTFTGRDTGAFASKERLLDLKLTGIDKITIAEQDKPVLLLEKQGERWQISGYFGFPVDHDKLAKVTDKLFGINKSWPVAATGAAWKRFKVIEDKFERKIVFSKADFVLNTLYIGSSPSYRKVHARIDDQDEVYSIEFSTFEAGSMPNDWADKSYLHVTQDQISELVLPTVTLKRDGEKLVVTELKENEETNASEINNLTNKIAKLTFSEVLGKEDQPEYQQQSPKMEIELTVKSGDRMKYTFSRLKDKDDYVLKKSTDDYYFKIAGYVVDGILEFSKEKLVKEKAKKEMDGDLGEKPDVPESGEQRMSFGTEITPNQQRFLKLFNITFGGVRN